MLHALTLQVKVAKKLGIVYQLHWGCIREGITLHATTSRHDTVQVRQGLYIFQNALFVKNSPEWYTLSLPLMHCQVLLAQDCLFQLSSSLCHQASCMCLPHDRVLPLTSHAVYSVKTRLPISSRRLIIEAYMFVCNPCPART